MFSMSTPTGSRRKHEAVDDLGTASLHLGEVPRMRETPLCNRTPMLDGDGTMSDAKTWVEERASVGEQMLQPRDEFGMWPEVPNPYRGGSDG